MTKGVASTVNSLGFNKTFFSHYESIRLHLLLEQVIDWCRTFTAKNTFHYWQ